MNVCKRVNVTDGVKCFELSIRLEKALYHVKWCFKWLNTFFNHVIICYRGNYPIREDHLSSRIAFRGKETLQIQWWWTRRLTARNKGREEAIIRWHWQCDHNQRSLHVVYVANFSLHRWLSAGTEQWSTLSRSQRAPRTGTRRIHLPTKKP